MNGKYLNRGLTVVAILGLTACGGGSGGNGPGGGTTDTTAPQVTAFSPASDATDVAPNSLIEITFNEALSSTGNVKVMNSQGYPVFGKTELSGDSRSVVFTPYTVLDNGEVHIVEVIGTKDSAGNAFAGAATYSFVTKQKFRILESHNDPTGNPFVYYTTERDLDGNTAIRRGFWQPGVDGEWFTADDSETPAYSMITLDTNGMPTTYVYFDAGDDGVSHTGDDIALQIEKLSYNARGQLTLKTIALVGPDFAPDTDDDIPSSRYIYTYDDKGKAESFLFYSSPGIDLQWDTDDDQITYFTFNEYGDDGYLSRFYFGGDPGADGFPGTEDDNLYFYFDYVVDLATSTMTEVGIYDAGDDGVWFSGDETPDDWTITRLIEGGVGYMYISYQDDGADGEALTADDLPYFYETGFFDEDRQIDHEISFFDAGEDGVWLNDDDVIGEYTTLEYDADGNLIRRYHFNDPGADEVWMNTDDKPFYELVFGD